MLIKRQYLYLIFLIILSFSCSTAKNTGTRRFYHKLVSRYNIYFNGREALQQGINQLETSHKNNFTNILDVFAYGTDNDALSVAPTMDRVNEKGSKVILNHSMSFKNIEYNPWVKESYLLIGKSRFFKGDFLAATETFDFISRKFTNDIIFYDAQLWLAKTHLYAMRYGKCEQVLATLENSINKGKTSEDVVRLYPMVRVQYDIKTNNLEEADIYIEKALQIKQKRKDKIRLCFIGGQVNQRLGNNQKAINYYQKTLALNPPYEIAFRARIFSAECYNSGMKEGDFIVKELLKMQKDAKNKDYLDEIYYALAQIEMTKRDSLKAIELYKLSTSSSISNNAQKGLSYYKLAEIHFNQKKYPECKVFYDSTIAFLPKTYESYKEINEKSKILTELIESLQTIKVQDSLQKVSVLPEKQLLSLIDKMINDYIRKEQLEEQRKKEEEQRLIGMGNKGNQGPVGMGKPVGAGGEWYFYNQSAVSFGKQEFKRKWGERKLDDLWRLHNKQVFSFDDFPDDKFEGTEKDDTLNANNDPKQREFYLKDILDTPEKIEKSDKKIELAYYNAGLIYKDKLKDYLPSIELLQLLLKRYPDSEFKLKTYYNLYLIYQILNLQKEKDVYKNLILKDFPNSEFAKIISDPDFYKNIASQQNEVKEFYKTTYLLYQEKQYNQVISNADEAKKKYKDPQLLPKFDFLKALSMAKLMPADSLKKQLNYIISNYPTSEVKPEAELILAYFNPSDSTKLQDTPKESTKTTELYQFNPNSFHLFILVVDVKTSNINTIRAALSDHNQKFFKAKNLTVSSLFLTDLRQMITVSKFNNQQDAEQYLKTFMNNTELNTSISKSNPMSFVISTDNYPVFYKNKNEFKYLEFFSQYYMRK